MELEHLKSQKNVFMGNDNLIVVTEYPKHTSQICYYTEEHIRADVLCLWPLSVVFPQCLLQSTFSRKSTTWSTPFLDNSTLCLYYCTKIKQVFVKNTTETLNLDWRETTVYFSLYVFHSTVVCSNCVRILRISFID